MAEYPSAIPNAKFKALFSKIRAVGVPTTKVDAKWLESYGFKTMNERGFISVLKFLGFIDKNGAPQDVWRAFRAQKEDEIAGVIIRDAYRELYEHTPDAHNAKKEDLNHFFRFKTPESGDVSIQRQVSNFLSLAAIASFNTDNTEQTVPQQQGSQVAVSGPSAQAQPVVHQQDHVIKLKDKSGVTINLNVQLTLPETADATMIDQIFAAMGKHLLQHR